jgi:peptidyl-prolyl cis-trans isomerase A (cyclophilin A)
MLIGIGLMLGPTGTASAAPPPVEVRLETKQGAIVIALDRRAPVTTANFLAYVDQHRLDGTSFYRAVRSGRGEGLVQGGISNDMTRMLKPVKHEPTSVTGLHHVDGTVSMARDDLGTATGDFFVVVGDGRYLDATRKDPGFAAFGHVVGGMALVRRMLAAPTFRGGWSKDTQGQQIVHPIRILSAQRIAAAPARR